LIDIKKDDIQRSLKNNMTEKNIINNHDNNRFNFSNEEDMLIDKDNKASFQSILLIRRFGKNQFNKKLIYATVISGKLDISDKLLIMPSLKESEIESIEINYNKITQINESQEIAIILKHTSEELNFNQDNNIIYSFSNNINLNEYKNNLVKTHLKNDIKKNIIESINGKFLYLGERKLKKNSTVNINYKGFIFSLYINEFELIDNDIKAEDNIKKDEFLIKGKNYKILFKPVNQIYFENIYWTHKDDSRFLARGKYYSLEGLGEFLAINISQ